MLRELLCKLTGYRYHYRINLKYRTKDHRPLADVNLTMKTTSPKYLEDHREVKKALAHILMEDIPKRLLCNGEIVFEPTFYLGLFKK